LAARIRPPVSEAIRGASDAQVHSFLLTRRAAVARCTPRAMHRDPPAAPRATCPWFRRREFHPGDERRELRPADRHVPTQRLATAQDPHLLPPDPALATVGGGAAPLRVRANAPPGRQLFPCFRTSPEAMMTDFRKLLDAVAVRAGWQARSRRRCSGIPTVRPDCRPWTVVHRSACAPWPGNWGTGATRW